MSCREDVLVECGVLGRPVGLRGELIVSWPNGVSPVQIGEELFVSARGKTKHKTLKVAALRRQGRFSVVRFEGVADRTAAEKLRGARLFVRRERLPKLPRGEYYTFEILGLEVETEDGQKLGRVENIFSTGANDVYEVRKGKKEILIPAVDNVIMKIDLKAGLIIVRLLDGMI